MHPDGGHIQERQLVATCMCTQGKCHRVSAQGREGICSACAATRTVHLCWILEGADADASLHVHKPLLVQPGCYCEMLFENARSGSGSGIVDDTVEQCQGLESRYFDIHVLNNVGEPGGLKHESRV